VPAEFSGDIPLDSEEALERAAKAFRANADRLAEEGLLVALESFPWSALANTRIAIDLLRRADAPNAGLLIDVWHFYNGGAHPDQLTDLPNAGITGFQLNDGPLVHDDFQQHARAERELPGEGELDVIGLICAVRRTGFTGPYCVESNTPEFRNLPVSEAAQRAADAATTVRRSAGVMAP
jgi:sugar phosphate isomerase/epimerase